MSFEEHERRVLDYPDPSARVDRDAVEGIIQGRVRQMLSDPPKRPHNSVYRSPSPARGAPLSRMG